MKVVGRVVCVSARTKMPSGPSLVCVAWEGAAMFRVPVMSIWTSGTIPWIEVAYGVVGEKVGMACRRGTVIVLTVTRFEDETADGRVDPEDGGKIR